MPRHRHRHLVGASKCCRHSPKGQEGEDFEVEGQVLTSLSLCMLLLAAYLKAEEAHPSRLSCLETSPGHPLYEL